MSLSISAVLQPPKPSLFLDCHFAAGRTFDGDYRLRKLKDFLAPSALFFPLVWDLLFFSLKIP